MKLKSRFFLGQILIGAFTFILFVWLLKDINVRNTRTPISEFKLKWSNQVCTSFLNRVLITANITVNTILGRMALPSDEGGLHAVDVGAGNKARVHSKKELKFNTPPKETLQIIVVPHSHNDPGWLKTYDEYFKEDTTHILSNIVEKLNQYRDMTFIWVETSFLRTWWINQTQATRSKFKDLVSGGRLEIVCGSFVAPDEASPHYFALIDQMVEGHYWVKKNLNVFPESVLSFDQFGYSASMSYLWKQAGLKQTLIKRIHYGVKQLMGEEHWMTFKWRQLWDPEGVHDIKTLVDTYEWMSISDSCGPDRGVCSSLDFSVMNDLPDLQSQEGRNTVILMDKQNVSSAKNIYDFASRIVSQYRQKASNYKQNVLLVPHGGDFHYSLPEHWDKQYRNMKQFMQYVNSKSEFNIHMRFGTMQSYFADLEAEEKKTPTQFPTISGDFFPYTESTDYWTGYFTTRQFDKRLGREVTESLRAAELFTSVAFAIFKKSKDQLFTEEQRSMLSKLSKARENLGIFQHHDAITGTSRAYVAIDYEKRLSASLTDLQTVISDALLYILRRDELSLQSFQKIQPTMQRLRYNQLTADVAVPVHSFATSLILVNPLTQSRREVVYVKIESVNIDIFDHKGKPVRFDILDEMVNIATIVFEVDFPAVSTLVYSIKPKSNSGEIHSTKEDSINKSPIVQKGPFLCNNIHMNVTFDRQTGSPLVICDKAKNACTDLTLDWKFYTELGGAYTMISNGRVSDAQMGRPHVELTSTPTLCRVIAAYGYFTTFVTLHRADGISGKCLKVEVFDDLSQQNSDGNLAMRLSTVIDNGRTFYEDSNGFQMMGRKMRTSLPFDANVYPMSSMAMIEDDEIRLVVHSAQPHGVISPSSGVLDLMVDRNGPRAEMGMPEGVRDNKPTLTQYFIEVQFAKGFQRANTEEATLPSLESVFLNDLLQHPIYSFYSMNAPEVFHPSRTLLSVPLSCDVILANVKNLASDDNLSEGLSLTFHRRGISCPSTSKEQFCPLHSAPEVTPGQFLNYYSHTAVKYVSLSHLYEYSNLVKDESVGLEPMDVKTFFLRND